MYDARLISLRNELRSLDRMTFLSSRQKKRRETILRQIESEKQSIELRLQRRDERKERTQNRHERVRIQREQRILLKKLELKENRKAKKNRRIDPAESAPPKPVLQPAVSQPTKVKRRRYCVMCGRRVLSQRRFCTRRCLKAFRRIPTPEYIQQECEKIIAQWSKNEEQSRTGRIGGAKFRLAAKVIENLGRPQAVNNNDAEFHDIAFHGKSTQRSDNDWWIDQIGARPAS